jgi:hypothetical protein
MRAPPEAWCREGPNSPQSTLLMLIKNRHITATPRLGVRDENDEKGYVPQETATLRIRDIAGRDLHIAFVQIKKLVSKPLNELTADDLAETVLYFDWRMVQEDLSYFHGQPIAPTEMVTIVHYRYLDQVDHHVLQTETATS